MINLTIEQQRLSSSISEFQDFEPILPGFTGFYRVCYRVLQNDRCFRQDLRPALRSPADPQRPNRRRRQLQVRSIEKRHFYWFFFLTNKKKELFSIFFWLRFVCQSSETQVHPTEATVILPSFTEFLFVFFWSKMGGTVPRLIYLQVILAIK